MRICFNTRRNEKRSEGGYIYIAILRKYRHLVRTIKQAPFEQITLSWILPVMGKRVQGYQNYHTKKKHNIFVKYYHAFRNLC